MATAVPGGRRGRRCGAAGRHAPAKRRAGQSTSTWRALYDGPAPDDLRPAFGLRRMSDVITSAAASIGFRITPGLAEPDAATVLVFVRHAWTLVARKGNCAL